MKRLYVIIFLVIRFGYNLKQKIQEFQVRLRYFFGYLIIFGFVVRKDHLNYKQKYILKSFIL